MEQRFDWREVVVGTERYFMSARAAEMLDVLSTDFGLDFGRFMHRHSERTGERFYKLWKGGRGEPQMVGEREGRFTSTHLHNLSWLDCEGEIVRIITVETGERCLVMEAHDLRRLLEQEPIPRITLSLWREASRSEQQATSAKEITGLLLDELEHHSIRAVFAENEVELGKFF